MTRKLLGILLAARNEIKKGESSKWSNKCSGGFTWRRHGARAPGKKKIKKIH